MYCCFWCFKEAKAAYYLLLNDYVDVLGMVWYDIAGMFGMFAAKLKKEFIKRAQWTVDLVTICKMCILSVSWRVFLALFGPLSAEFMFICKKAKKMKKG